MGVSLMDLAAGDSVVGVARAGELAEEVEAELDDLAEPGAGTDPGAADATAEPRGDDGVWDAGEPEASR
jgi:hypothetical protein